MFKKGYKQTEMHRKKLLESRLLAMKEGRINFKSWNKGLKNVYSKDTLDKMSKSHLGKKYKPMSLEGRKNVREATKLAMSNPTMKKKLSDIKKEGFKNGTLMPPNKGKFFSESHKKNLSISHIGFVPSEETKIKLKLSRARQVIPFRDTKIEIIIQNILSLNKIPHINHKYISNIEHKYQCDHFIEPNIIIEDDGCYYHGCHVCFSNGCCRKNINDTVRNNELEEAGYIVLRFWEHEIKNNIDDCINTIKSVILWNSLDTRCNI